jgi:DNA-binding transcriptional regulator YiaG
MAKCCRTFAIVIIAQPVDPVRLARLRRLTAGGKARRLRLRNQLSLSDVSASVGVTPSCILRWETGERLPRGNEAALRYLSLLEELERS